MKPKKGETNVEMDEPMRNPLQLVKELVLLIAEARTPDPSVKGRIEGPHCPVIRGRPAHKCSVEKAECVRANEFCSLAQRLWLNSIPVCLDILLFPACIHGQEEASVTEGTVTKRSKENALLIERWIIDGNKRRQDDCLSSSMLIQAVRSYLHFSQISSWLYCTGGKLPGILVYRVYAPGEVTSLDFPQTPDNHSFPVCLVNFHHIRVRVSSLQRQSSVPILLCLQEQTMGNNPGVALCSDDNTQKKKSEKAKVKIRHEHLKDFMFRGNLWTSGMSQPTNPSASVYSTLAKTLKNSKKYVKSLQEVSAQHLSGVEMNMCDPSVAFTSQILSASSSRTGNLLSSREETDNRHTLCDADISARKAKYLARMKISDGGDDAQMSGNVLYSTKNYVTRDLAYEDEVGETSLDTQMNDAFAVTTFAPDLGKKVKSSDLKMNRGLLAQVATQGTSLKNKPPVVNFSQDEEDNEWSAVNNYERRWMRVKKKDGEKDLRIEQMKIGLYMDTQERKLKTFIGEETECRQTNEDDVQTLIRQKKKTEYCKFRKSLDEGHVGFNADLEMWWPLHEQGVKKLSHDLQDSKDIGNSDDKKWLFPAFPKEKFHDGTTRDHRDMSAFYKKASIESKPQARKKNDITHKEVSEEELIRILSDRLSVVTSPQREMFASPKFSSKFQDNEAIDKTAVLKGLVQREINSQQKEKLSQSRVTEDDTETAGFDNVREEMTNKFVKKYSVQDAKLSRLTIDISKSPDILEDSDDTPVASPNQTPRPKSVSESLMKSVAEKSIKQSLQWLQKDLRNPVCDDKPIELTDFSSISKSDFQIDSDSRFVTLGTNKGLKSNDSQLSDNETYLKENGYINEDPFGENHFMRDQDLTQPSSRRMFEENLLPLVSYDADSDSFRKVEELYSSNILHSPKVLFSCDVPDTKMSSRKCIDFDDTFEAEFLKSKISDLVDTEAIGKYMSNLAIFSSSFTDGKKNQDEDNLLDKVKQVENLDKHDILSNLIEVSSNSDYLLKDGREVLDVQTDTNIAVQIDTNIADLQSTQNNCFIKTQHHIDDIMKEKPDKGMQGNPDVGVEELCDENPQECLVNNDSFNQTRRQLNFIYVENTNTRRMKDQKGLVALPANVSSSAVHGSSVHVQNIQMNEERTLPGITGSREIAISSPSDAVVSPTASPVSSLYSSSSSSSSSVRMVSGSLSPTSPTALTTSANKQETFTTEKGDGGDDCAINVQELLCTCSSSSISDKNSLEEVDGNTTTIPTGRKSNTHKELQSDLKSNWTSPCNRESLIFTFSDAIFPMSSASLSTTISSSLHSTSIPAYPQPSSVLMSQPVLHDATHNNLCHNDKNSPTSLSKVIIPQPSPQDDADFDKRSFFNFAPEPNSQCDSQPSLFVCDKKVQIRYDLNSHRVSNTEIPECVPNLLQDQTLVNHEFDIESAACDHSDGIFTSVQGSISDNKSIAKGTALLKAAVSHAATSLETSSKVDTTITKSVQEDAPNPSAITKSTSDSLKNKKPPETGRVEMESNVVNREINVKNVPTVSSSLNTVTAAETGTSNRITEPRSEAPQTVSIGDIYSSKYKDSSKYEFNTHVIPVPEADSESLCSIRTIMDSLSKVPLKCCGSSNSEIENPLAKTAVSKDSSLSPKQSELYLEMKEHFSIIGDLDSESKARSQNVESSEKMLHSSFVEQQAGSYTSSIDLNTTEVSDMNKRGQYLAMQNESLNLQHQSVKIIQTRQDSKNRSQVKDEEANKEKDVDAGDWNNDVVFYLSEPENKMKVDPPKSQLSNSLKEVIIPSENYKAVRPLSLSAEVNLEMRLRSDPGIKNKSNLDFSNHLGSHPFPSDPPGWSSAPPHRTVSTPSCMNREVKSKDERTSSNIPVIQQQNCDNMSQTGLRRMAAKSASMIFNNRTGLPTQSSPAPLKRKSGGRFDYDVSLLNTRALKNAFSCSKLASDVGDGDGDNEEDKKRTLSTSAPASTNCLLGNFEESILNGRIDPVGIVDGFTAEIGASGSFCPKHLHLPVSAFFFALSDDNAPSPYLGHINLESVGKKGYHIPKKGTVQVTLFNPNMTVVKMFVVVYDLYDMPASSQTFIRQRTVYSPIDKNITAPSYLRYLIHLRCASSQSGKIYLHTDIRLIFSRHKVDIDAKTIPYELKSYTEGPQNPKYSPKK